MLDSLGLQGGERAVMVETLFKSHFDEAPEATLEWVRSLSSTERQALLYQRLGRVIGKSPDMARQLYAENRGMDFGLLNSNALAKALIESDIEAAKAWAEELPAGNMQRDVRHRVISALSERDPQAAAAYISESGLMRMHGDTLVHHWFEQDREALVRWVASQEHQETGRDLERSLAMRWSQDDPAGALEYLAGVGTESERLENSKRVVSSWAELEPALATKYVRGLASSEQAPLISSLVKGLSNVDPGGAAALLDAQLEEPSRTTGLVDAADLVAGRWGDLDVEAAGAWAQTLQEGSMRRRVVPTVAHDWVRADLEGASEWIATLDPGVSRDRAVTILVGQLSGPDPEAAFAWALTLENTDHRASKLEDVLTSWRDRDYDAAYQAFQAAELDEKTRETLSWRFKK